jgi:hypothetical protein
MALAKDVYRLVIERLNRQAFVGIVSPPKGQDWGTLKCLEATLALQIGDEPAKVVMGPLFGLNELRRADAHLPPGQLLTAYELLEIDPVNPPLLQGTALLRTVTGKLFELAAILDTRGEPKAPGPTTPAP